MKVYTCDNFEGHYPVGAAAVIVAANPLAAKLMLEDHLREIGLPQTKPNLEIKELPMKPGVTVLVDGNY